MIGDIFGIGELICKLLILMVAGIFKLVSGAYQIFLVLAKTNIFEQDTYAHLTDKVYIILAVTMLFVVAYTFITLIIDPDKNKGGKAVEDLIKKSVTSLILIVLCPTLFTLAFDLQDAIMDQDIIGKFFTSETSGEEETKKSVKQGGNLMAGTTFAAFFYPTFESTTTYELKNQSEGKHLKKDEYEIDCSKTGSCTLQEAIDYASATGTFSVFTAFAKNWLDGEQQKTSVDFNMLLALIAGFYLLWVIISFCFDLAIRVIKLAFYQVIAPICIACRMLPDKDSIFKNWWKAVCKTYLSIFIRVFIMNLAVFLMVELTKSNFWSNICNSEEMECGGVIKFLAFAFLVLGLVTFIKQASKLIDEIFGLGDVKLGIKDKWKEGTSLITSAAGTGAAIGFGAAGLVKGTINGKGNPLAGIRAARMNAKNKNLSGNRAEFERRRAYDVALQNGATRGQLARDYMRHKLGMASLKEQEDYRIEDIEYVEDGKGGRLSYADVEVENADGTKTHKLQIVDSTGQTVRDMGNLTASNSHLVGTEVQYNSEFAQASKLASEAEDRIIKDVEDQIRQMQKFNSSNQTVMGYRKALMSRVEDKMREGQKWWGTITRSSSFTDANGKVYNLSGNFSTLESSVKKLLEDKDIDGATKTAIQQWWAKEREDMLFEGVNRATAVGSAEYDNNAATSLQKIKDAITAGEFRELDGRIALGDNDIRGKTSHEIAELVKKNAGRIDGEYSIEAARLESQKGTAETTKKNIAQVERLHADTQAQQRTKPEYQGMQASGQHISNNPNITSTGSGSNSSASHKKE